MSGRKLALIIWGPVVLVAFVLLLARCAAALQGDPEEAANTSRAINEQAARLAEKAKQQP